MKPALFLDRDGVINVEKNYVHRIEDFEFIDGIFELCKMAQDMGYAIIVITNQAGIGRGYYTEADFHRLTEWMIDQFRQHGIHIDGVYFCPFHPTGGVGEYRRESFDRKPNPGMLLRARDERGIDLAQSVFVGDKASDMEAAGAAGVPNKVLLTRSKEEGETHPGSLVIADLEAVGQWLAGQAPRALPTANSTVS